MRKTDVVILCYTERAAKLAERLTGKLSEAAEDGHVNCTLYLHNTHAASHENVGVAEPARSGTENTEPVAGYKSEADICVFTETSEVLDEVWENADMILFIAATGIAVRTIAPYLKDKTTDPAVLCMDENAGFVIPLVSGHLGGANEWAQKIADLCGAQAVITTATDGRGVFAIDLFAKENDLVIANRDMIKEISGALLAGEKVGWYSDAWLTEKDFAVSGQRGFGEDIEKKGFVRCGRADEKDTEEERPKTGVTLTSDEMLPRQFERECRLYLRDLYLGIGCKKGTDETALQNFVYKTLEAEHLSVSRVREIASIDVKKEERAIRSLAERLKVPYTVFPAEKLAKQQGDFSSSDFVASQVGVDNVCERSAVCVAGAGALLLVKKTARDGMTVAVARGEV